MIKIRITAHDTCQLILVSFQFKHFPCYFFSITQETSLLQNLNNIKRFFFFPVHSYLQSSENCLKCKSVCLSSQHSFHSSPVLLPAVSLGGFCFAPQLSELNCSAPSRNWVCKHSLKHSIPQNNCLKAVGNTELCH